MTAVKDSDPLATTRGMGSETWHQARRVAVDAVTRVGAWAERDDVARYPLLATALRNIGGLPERPAQEIALGAVTVAIMIATDSVLVEIGAQLVAVLLINHPHGDDTDAQEPR